MADVDCGFGGVTYGNRWRLCTVGAHVYFIARIPVRLSGVFRARCVRRMCSVLRCGDDRTLGKQTDFYP